MSKKTDDKIIQAVLSAVRDLEVFLVNHDYLAVGSESRNSFLSSFDIEDALSEFDGQITLSPESSYQALQPVLVLDAKPERWFLDLPLWIDEKMSDVVVAVTIEATPLGLEASIDDIRVG